MTGFRDPGGVILGPYGGLGGWAEGMWMLGLAEVGIELDPWACATRTKAGHQTIRADVATFPLGHLTGRVEGLAMSPPCFVAGTPVLTARGSIPIERVVVGDLVWTHRNRWRRVAGTMSRIAETVRIGPIQCTPDHPFLARPQVRTWNNTARRYDWHLGDDDWVRADKIQGQFTASPINVSGLQADWPCDPWLAGRYMADGWSGRDGVMVAVGAGKEAEFEALSGRAGWATSKTGPNCSRYTLCDKALAARLERDFGKGAVNKTFPTWVLAAREVERRAFLAGYLSGDGATTESGWCLTTVSDHLVSQVRLLAISLGYTVTLSRVAVTPTKVIEGRLVNQRPQWKLVINRNDGRYTRDLAGLRWAKQRKPVAPAGAAEVFDLTVDGDHSFVAWGTVVHNCQSFSAAGKGEGRKVLDRLVGAVHAGDWHAVDSTRAAGYGHVLEVGRWVETLRPRWVVCEQVPEVLPVWRAYAERWRVAGWSTWAGVLCAADFGVPQTRRRAFLLASRVRRVAPPAPTHAEHPQAALFGPTLAPWVSMADALGWGLPAAPSPVVMTARNRQTGHDVLRGSSWRHEWFRRQQRAGNWVSPVTPAGEPLCDECGCPEDVHDADGFCAGPCGGNCTDGGRRPRNDDIVLNRRQNSRTADGGSELVRLVPISEPALTLTGIAGSKGQWVWQWPTTTIAGDPRITARCHHDEGSQGRDATSTDQVRAGDYEGTEPIQLTLPEALTLQGFDPAYPVQGNKSQRFQQVGNACPPLLAAHVVAAATGRVLELPAPEALEAAG